MVVSEKLKKIIALVKKIPYDNGFLIGRKTLQNINVKHRDEGIIVMSKVKDNETVFVGTYTMLKENHPQLKY